MRYLYLFFLLLCVCPITKAADIPASITTIYTKTADSKPIEPIQKQITGKKSYKKSLRLQKMKRADGVDVLLGFLTFIGALLLLGIVVGVLTFVSISFPFGWFYGIKWLWISGAVIQGSLIILWIWKAIENWKNYLWTIKYKYRESKTSPYSDFLLDFVGIFAILLLNSIGFLIIGFLFNINWLWISAIVGILGFLALIIYLLASL